MKILYSVQATGNGHISRAMELLPFLEKYGIVDLFLSGSNSTLDLRAPIKYRSKGLSLFYTCTGNIDYWKLVQTLAPIRVLREARDLPVEKYDLVLNDFDSITALACYLKNVRSIQFGHQASFQSTNTPRPQVQNKLGEWVLKNYARASTYIGLHFDKYDDFILSPVIKNEVAFSSPTNKGHVTVYLPSYCKKQLRSQFSRFNGQRFEIFSHELKQPEIDNNIRWMPVSKSSFDASLLSCSGIITGGGFETPAEALFLGKKLIAIPIRGQYEQQCNGAALKKLGVTILDKLDENFESIFSSWMNESTTSSLPSFKSTADIVDQVMDMAMGT